MYSEELAVAVRTIAHQAKRISQLEAELATARRDALEQAAKVCEDQHTEWAKRSYPPPKILKTLAAEIRALMVPK